MKAGALAVGIVLLVIGALGFVYAQTQVSEYQSFMGQLGRTFSRDMQTQYQTLQYMMLGSVAIGVIGIGVTIYGAVAKGKVRCKCGHINKADAKFCFICGEKLA
jgi:hypothetical protein